MTFVQPQVHLSLIDEDRFGIRIARAINVRADQLDAIDSFCITNQVRMLIARCFVDELSTAQDMESRGYSLMDTLIYFKRKLAAAAIPDFSSAVLIRPVEQEEAEIVATLAVDMFRGYKGHYHADRRLNPADCDHVYSSWAYRSIQLRQVADVVLVAEHEGQVAGFIALRMNSKSEGEGTLYGVSPAVQGHGIGRNLIIGALRWLESTGADHMIISTQITNVPSQKVWVRLGFEPMHAHYTFHKWYDESA
ncbi:MAG: GNAT family N-acetyltransferase [Anaerolineae bacterium]|nr:GNAT family N-acetyltransferase [Anaerolineae bacterium]